MNARLAALVLAIAATGGCGPIDQRNELVIAISTTLKPGTGKDFDQLRVEVFLNGERLEKKDFGDLGQRGLTEPAEPAKVGAGPADPAIRLGNDVRAMRTDASCVR